MIVNVVLAADAVRKSTSGNLRTSADTMI